MANESASASNDVSTVPLQPLVFQCRACRTVVGDSVNFDCSVRSLACVALTGASGLTVDPHPQATVLPRDATGPSGRVASDDESGRAATAVAFVSLACSGCGAALGKRFGERGLPARLARIAGLFCLEVDSISSYELGKPELVAAVSTAGKREEAAMAAATTTTTTTTTEPNGKDSLALSSLLSRVAELEEELVKVQNVVLGHNEALAALANLQEQQQGQQRR